MKALTLDLNKSANSLRLSLEKAGLVIPKVDLAFNLDVSGSFDDEHREGLTQALLSRLVPWGMVFDPDGKMDVFTFSSGESYAHYVGDITAATHEGYIAQKIINRVPGYNGGTDYSYVLEKNLKHFGWTPATNIAVPAQAPAKKGFLGGLFGKKPETLTPQPAATQTPAVPKKRSIVIHVTDGDNSDKARTEQILAESEQRGDQVYFLFIGVSNQGSQFPFLEKIGDKFGNTGLVTIKDLKQFVEMSDEELNGLLLGEELINWLKA